jgi:hypothetical protein
MWLGISSPRARGREQFALNIEHTVIDASANAYNYTDPDPYA